MSSTVLAVPGLLLGGYIADRLSKRDRRWPAWLCSIAVLLAFPFYMIALWMDNWVVATVLFSIGIFLYQLSHGPGLAIVQSVVPSHQRAQAAAYVFFLANIFGLGLGPLLVGIFSDLVTAQFGEKSLNVALSIVVTMLLAASIGYWRTGKAMASLESNNVPNPNN